MSGLGPRMWGNVSRSWSGSGVVDGLRLEALRPGLGPIQVTACITSPILPAAVRSEKYCTTVVL
jgi:hypothetical protein